MSLAWTYHATAHKARVAWYLLKACAALIKRAIRHDLSKYGPEEAPAYSRALPSLQDADYASDQYAAAIHLLGPALQHHYANNTHHPEHWPNITQMSPLDLIEMLCDWKAAADGHKASNFTHSLQLNQTRFHYDTPTADVLTSAAKEIRLCP